MVRYRHHQMPTLANGDHSTTIVILCHCFRYYHYSQGYSTKKEDHFTISKLMALEQNK